jgi:hypothetical protein
MNGRELRVFGAVMIVSGTLVVGLDEAWQPATSRIMLVEDVGSHAVNGQESVTGMAPVDARDNGRMNTRQNSTQGLDMNRSPAESSVSSPQAGPVGYDARRRDESRIDSRYDGGLLPPAPSNVNVTR